jgi:hypothetical protein
MIASEPVKRPHHK